MIFENKELVETSNFFENIFKKVYKIVKVMNG